jgi:hypothetical protein
MERDPREGLALGKVGAHVFTIYHHWVVLLFSNKEWRGRSGYMHLCWADLEI